MVIKDWNTLVFIIINSNNNKLYIYYLKLGTVGPAINIENVNEVSGDLTTYMVCQ